MYNPLKQNYGHIKAIELRQINSDELVVYDVELSEYISRKLTRLKLENSEPSLSPEQIDAIYDRLSKSNITDQAVRNQHVHRILTNTKGNKGNRT
ncbi:hypothetical protein J41TS12_13670 [Paenibacillus antibioticophila]|uniref:Uncharacterized protein n=2 Tax=Paenibacillus antibioticophila TaxID=1274374 RepID=A0A920CE28_9BACL|nr:hypothetical protein J41TS12_13670 [Paenibacillus antibioticophila]